LFRVLLHNSLKNFPNSAIASYTSLSINPLMATGKILCSRMWQSCVFSPCNLVPSALTHLEMLLEI
jgi:hypothetical protein